MTDMKPSYVCDDFLIVFKPHNLPTVPLKNQETDTLLDRVSLDFPEVKTVYGKNSWEGSALHRLDTATAGLVLFARNQKAYDRLSQLQSEDKMIKTYIAESKGKTDKENITVSTYFRSFGPKGQMVKAEEVKEKSDNGRLYTTTIKKLNSNTENTVFECKITRGFRHQIRVHLAYIGCPITGDTLYNPEKENSDLMLTCTGLEFEDFKYYER